MHVIIYNKEVDSIYELFRLKKTKSQEPSFLSFELCDIHFIHWMIIPVQSQCK
jgi:hypothetical protein